MDLSNLKIDGLTNEIDKAQSISIIPHKNPDGDAIGSTLGLLHYLQTKGKKCKIVVEDVLPKYLDFLPESASIVSLEEKETQANDVIKGSDLIFLLDFNHISRSGKLETSIQSNPCKKVVVDHHPFPQEGFDFYYHDTKASSTSELVYLLIQEIDQGFELTTDFATCIYTGLLTDTGCFKYALRPQTFQVASELLKTGISYEFIVSKIFDSNTPEKIKLLGYALNDKLSILRDYRTAYISLSHTESTELGLEKGDTEGLVNYTLSIDDTLFGVFFHEKEPGLTKISFRSKGDFAVNEIASEYFNGGGHKNAAGGQFEGNIEDCLRKFMEVLPQYKESLSSLEIGKRTP